MQHKEKGGRRTRASTFSLQIGQHLEKKEYCFPVSSRQLSSLLQGRFLPSSRSKPLFVSARAAYFPASARFSEQHPFFCSFNNSCRSGEELCLLPGYPLAVPWEDSYVRFSRAVQPSPWASPIFRSITRDKKRQLLCKQTWQNIRCWRLPPHFPHSAHHLGLKIQRSHSWLQFHI